MKLINLLKMLGALVILSFYFFPFETTHLPGANTKMVLAFFSLPLLAFQVGKKRSGLVDKELFLLSLYASFVSLSGFLAVVYNGTNDFTYATYIVSMWVWLGGAYTALQCIKMVHGFLSVRLLLNYLIALCVAQCALALLIDYNATMKYLASQIMVVTPVMKYRLYGIDASLDIAGSRFSAVLLMIVHCCLSREYDKNYKTYFLWCIFAFIFIAVVGNMISRTTTVGVGLAFFYIILLCVCRRNSSQHIFLGWFFTVLVLLIPLVFYLYHHNLQFAENFRFGFEGFFSLVEKGEWQTNSNDILKNMYVFPESTKTWLIGDGYFDNPYYADPYYTGKIHGGYYMSTDVGYCRFLFYFGLIGLCSFIFFLFQVTLVCMNRFPKDRLLFILLLALNFIVWFKVSTDIFLVFAAFLCITKEDNNKHECECVKEIE